MILSDFFEGNILDKQYHFHMANFLVFWTITTKRWLCVSFQDKKQKLSFLISYTWRLYVSKLVCKSFVHTPTVS